MATLLLAGCAADEEQPQIDWSEKTDTLAAVDMHYSPKDTSLLHVSSFTCWDNYLFLGQERVPDELLSLYECRGDSLIRLGNLIKEGKGPFETLGRAYAIVRDDSTLLLAPSGYNRQFYVATTNPDSLLDKKTWKVLNYPTTDSYLSMPALVGLNGCMMPSLVANDEKQNMFDRFTFGDTVYTPVYSPYPQNETKAANGAQSQVYDVRLYRKPGSDRYVYVTYMEEQVCIFDLRNDSVINRNYVYNKQPKFEMAPDGLNVSYSNDNTLGFLVDVSPKYIYLMKKLIKLGDLGVIPDYKGYPLGYSDVILLFDWDGKPIRRFILDTPVSVIGADRLDRYIYGSTIDLETDKQRIVRFALPQIEN